MTVKTSNISIMKQTYQYMLMLTSSAIAENKTVPEHIKDTTKISAEDLISLAETTPELVTIDTRIKKDHNHDYIEGSIIAQY